MPLALNKIEVERKRYAICFVKVDERISIANHTELAVEAYKKVLLPVKS